MTLLTCDIDAYYRVSVPIELKDEERRNGEKRVASSLSVNLVDRESEQIITSTRISWPTGEEYPTEISYDDANNVVILKGDTSTARIPFRPAVIRRHVCPTKSVRIISSFLPKADTAPKVNGTVHVKKPSNSTDATSPVTEHIYSLLKHDTDEYLKKAMMAVNTTRSSPSSLRGFFSYAQQKKLLKSIEKSKLNRKEKTEYLMYLFDKGTFSYSVLDDVYVLAESLGGIDLEELFLSKPMLVPEKTMVRFLKQCTCRSATAMLSRLLRLDFDTEALAVECHSQIDVQDSTMLFEQLLRYYITILEDNELSEKVMTVMSTVFDAQFNRFLLDAPSYEKMDSFTHSVGELAGVLESVSKLESLLDARQTLGKLFTPAPPPDFEIRKVTLTPFQRKRTSSRGSTA